MTRDSPQSRTPAGDSEQPVSILLVVDNPNALERLNPKFGLRMADRHLRTWNLGVTCKDGSVKTVAWSNIAGLCPVPGWSCWSLGWEVQATVDRKQVAAPKRGDTP